MSAGSLTAAGRGAVNGPLEARPWRVDSSAARSAALVVLLVSGAASAHAVGLSQGSYAASGSTVEAELTFNRAELASVAGDVPLEQWVTRRIVVAGCERTAQSQRPLERDGVRIEGSWRCPSASSDAQVQLEFLTDLPPGHRHLAAHQVFHAGARLLTLTVAREAHFTAMVRLGVEHILTGWDHLLFLFGMVLVAGRKRAVLKVVTAFTVAHSITLAIGALALFAPSPRWVEPLIALSIAWIGVENLALKDLERRWRVAFLFGLLHGFGFAGGLQDIGASANQLPLALLGFNVGVELGQLAVLAVLLPALAMARTSARLWPVARPVLSALVIVPGLFWFVERLQG